MSYNEELIQLHTDVSNLRGKILDRVVIMERHVDMYLAQYFSKEKIQQEEMLNLLWCTDRITLNAKYQIFEFLIKKHHVDFIAKYPTFLKDYESVSQERNIFAHYLLDDSEEAVSKRHEWFRFVKFKNKRTYSEYDEKKIRLIFEQSKSVILRLQELIP